MGATIGAAPINPAVAPTAAQLAQAAPLVLAPRATPQRRRYIKYKKKYPK